MTRGQRTRTEPARPLPRESAIRSAELTDEQRQRLEQARLLSDPHVRALWPHLKPAQQRSILDPVKVVGHRFPLSTRDLTNLTGLSQRQVRYYADGDLIPHWKEGGARKFEAVGLIMSYALSSMHQSDMQFYRRLREEPIDDIVTHVWILTNLINTRLQEAKPSDARKLQHIIQTFSLAWDETDEHPANTATTAEKQ